MIMMVSKSFFMYFFYLWVILEIISDEGEGLVEKQQSAFHEGDLTLSWILRCYYITFKDNDGEGRKN